MGREKMKGDRGRNGNLIINPESKMTKSWSEKTEVKISDFSLLLRHDLPLNSLSFKLQHWLLTLTDRCMELWMHVTLYSAKDYLKAFWKRNTKVISIAFINSWSRSRKGSKGFIVELQDKETELVGEQLPLGVKNDFAHEVPSSSCDACSGRR